MKLTRKRLIEIINEEISKLNEDGPEVIDTDETVIEPKVDSNISDNTSDNTHTVSTTTASISSDIDSILNSLETLSAQLTESLNESVLDYEETLNELQAADLAAISAVGGALALAARATYRYKVLVPKARKEQAKVNKIKMKIADLKFAHDNLDGSTDAGKAKKEKIKIKYDAIKANADDLQKIVDDKYEGKGSAVKKALANEKIKGRLEVAKRSVGETDDPKEAARLKDQMSKLNQKLKSEEKALQELEPSKEEQEKAAELAKKQAKEQADKEKMKKDAEAEANKKDEKPAKEEPKEKTEEEPEEEEEIKSVEKTKKKNESMSSKESKLNKLSEIIDNALVSENEEIVTKAEALKARIESKENWQIDGTVLGGLLESEITAIESELILNESKYHNLSIKDRLNKLI